MEKKPHFRRDLVRMYPQRKQWVLRDEERQRFHLHLISTQCRRESLKILDVGGHVGPFGPWAAMHGHQVTVLDDFGDDKNARTQNAVLNPEYTTIISDVHSVLGVQTIKHDLGDGKLPLGGKQFDVLTCFQVIEHLHGGVRSLMHEFTRVLKPGGLVVISGPNAVNLRKRITVACGVNNFSRFSDWYTDTQFRGHVREPVVSDLVAIANDLSLSEVKIFGKNWMATKSKRLFLRLTARLMWPLIAARPHLASNIYMCGKTQKDRLT